VAGQGDPMATQLSIVVPLRNEERNVEPLWSEIRSAVVRIPGNAEILLVDDHSSDQTGAICARLAGFAQGDPLIVRALRNTCQPGKDGALRTGLGACAGEVIVTLDGDLQNDPADIPLLLDSLDSCDIVCGIRKLRRDCMARRVVSRIANVVRNFVTGDNIRDAGCALRAMKHWCTGPILKYDLRLCGCAHCFYPSLVRMHGGRVSQVEVGHRPRPTGGSKFALVRGRLGPGIRACIEVRRLKKLLDCRVA